MKNKDNKISKSSHVVHASSDPLANHGIVNVPVYHTSTILKANLDDYRNSRGKFDYGRIGTPTTEASEKAVAELYEMDDAIATPSGLAAISLGISGVVNAGDHALFPDSMYGSGRRFVENILPRMGVKYDFYDPTNAQDLAAMVSENTTLIYIESPGSQTFEMQDIPAIVRLAHDRNCLVACDNTWATAFYFDANAHNIDIVIEAGTKYISGHSDVSIGYVVANGDTAKRIRQYAKLTGICVAPDDHYLALRGMRTMRVRLHASEENAIALATWLQEQPEVIAMLHPALPSHPGHHHWKRDFSGSSGLFSFLLNPDIPFAAIDAMVDGLKLFGIGDSWGGHESLINQAKITRSVTAMPAGTLLRIYTGIEDKDDLLNDLASGMERLRKAMAS
jgi:cystathionine beta-lyase